jgi:hypothetical protein
MTALHIAIFVVGLFTGSFIGVGTMALPTMSRDSEGEE